MSTSSTARIVHGQLPADISLIDEPNMLVQSYTFTPARTKNEYRGANRCVKGVEYLDPIGTHAFEAFVSSRTGLCDQHPGTTVAELANFTGTRSGFAVTDGKLIYEDPVFTQNLTQPETITFNVLHYPFVSAS